MATTTNSKKNVSKTAQHKKPGPKPGSQQKRTQQRRLKRAQQAEATGMLPHEFLLLVSQGHPIKQHDWEYKYNKDGEITSKKKIIVDVYPDFEMRIDAAKACAPYYAPKLATQMIKPADEDTEVTITYKRVS